MLSRFASIEMVDLPAEPTPDRPSPLEKEAVLKKEALRLEKAIQGFDQVIVLAVEGKSYTSEGFAAALEPSVKRGQSLCFVIGGSFGLHDEIKKRASWLLSLSSLTFPHRISKILLLEQLFRAYKIIHHETYHK